MCTWYTRLILVRLYYRSYKSHGLAFIKLHSTFNITRTPKHLKILKTGILQRIFRMSTEPPQTLKVFNFWQQCYFRSLFCVVRIFDMFFLFFCLWFLNLTFPRKSLLFQLFFLIKKNRTFLKLISRIFNALVFIICNNLICD